MPKPEKEDIAHNPRPGSAENGAVHRRVGPQAIAATAGFAAVYVTLGRPDNAVSPVVQNARHPKPRPAGGGAGRARHQSPEPGADGRPSCSARRREAPPGGEIPSTRRGKGALARGNWRGKGGAAQTWWANLVACPAGKEMPATRPACKREMGSDTFQVGGSERRSHRAARGQRSSSPTPAPRRSPSMPTRPRPQWGVALRAPPACRRPLLPRPPRPRDRPPSSAPAEWDGEGRQAPDRRGDEVRTACRLP